MKSPPAAKLRTLAPVGALKHLTSASPPAVMNSAFLPMNKSRVTCLVWALMVRTCSPFSKSQILTVLSPPALANSLPSAIQPTSSTACVCPSNDLANSPLGRFQILMYLSDEQVARKWAGCVLSLGGFLSLGSGSFWPGSGTWISPLKARPYTVSEWQLLRLSCCFQSPTSKILTSPSTVGSPPPAPSCLPSGEKARATTL